MLKNCPVVQLFEAHPEQFAYDPWPGIGSNYVVFKDGWERFVETSKKDATKFDQNEADRIKDEILDKFHGPQGYDVFRGQGIAFDLPENAPKAPAGWGSKFDPLVSTVTEQNGCYGKVGKEGIFELLTPFTIEPKELLMLTDGDVLTCKVKHATGQEWDNVTIENVDWHTRGRFMKSLGHSECTFHGSDLQLIDVCQHVIMLSATEVVGPLAPSHRILARTRCAFLEVITFSLAAGSSTSHSRNNASSRSIASASGKPVMDPVSPHAFLASAAMPSPRGL